MSPRTRLAAYALVLAIALGGGAGLGSVVGPIQTDDTDHPSTPSSPSAPPPAHGGHTSQ